MEPKHVSLSKETHLTNHRFLGFKVLCFFFGGVSLVLENFKDSPPPMPAPLLQNDGQ